MIRTEIRNQESEIAHLPLQLNLSEHSEGIRIEAPSIRDTIISFNHSNSSGEVSPTNFIINLASTPSNNVSMEEALIEADRDFHNYIERITNVGQTTSEICVHVGENYLRLRMRFQSLQTHIYTRASEIRGIMDTPPEVPGLLSQWYNIGCLSIGIIAGAACTYLLFRYLGQPFLQALPIVVEAGVSIAQSVSTSEASSNPPQTNKKGVSPIWFLGVGGCGSLLIRKLFK